jgi:hypothetical protein
MKNTLLAFGFALAACGQAPHGSIDGVALPAKAFESCSSLRVYIDAAPRAAAARDFGITVTPEEEAAEQAWAASNLAAQAPEQRLFYQDLRDLLAPALAEVYEQHRNADEVYANRLAGSKITREAWELEVNQDPNAKTAEGREKIRQTYVKAMDFYSNPTRFSYNAKAAVERRKLDAEVDRRLAASDPEFAAELRDWKASERINSDRSVGHTFNGPMAKNGVPLYMEQKREQFWAARKAKQRVVLSDPTLKAKCGL